MFRTFDTTQTKVLQVKWKSNRTFRKREAFMAFYDIGAPRLKRFVPYPKNDLSKNKIESR